MTIARPIALAFDLDNTLWDIEPVMVRAEKALHDWLSVNCPRIVELHTIESMRARRQEVAIRRPELAHDFTALRKISLHEHAVEAGYAASTAEAAFEHFYHERNQVALFEDVLPALDQLRAEYRLLALTNGNADLKRIGIADYFELIMTARSVGHAKPDPRIFHALMTGAALTPGQLLYVGDEPLADVEGPRSVGIESVWVNRGGETWPAEFAPPRLTVRTLHELVEWLGVLE